MNKTEIGYRLVVATGNLMQTLADYHWGERKLDREVLASDYADIMTLLDKAAAAVGVVDDSRVIHRSIDTNDELQLASWLVEFAGMLDASKPHPALGTGILARTRHAVETFAKSYGVGL